MGAFTARATSGALVTSRKFSVSVNRTHRSTVQSVPTAPHGNDNKGLKFERLRTNEYQKRDGELDIAPNASFPVPRDRARRIPRSEQSATLSRDSCPFEDRFFPLEVPYFVFANEKEPP
jgi:hypothetical protein